MAFPTTLPRLVVVEDVAEARSALSRLLSLSGYEVLPAATISEALAVAERHGCDLLISDIGLPDGSGLDLMRTIRATYRASRGIALTGYTSAEDIRACMDAGFSKYLPKPVSFAALLVEVERLLAPATSGGAEIPSL